MSARHMFPLMAAYLGILVELVVGNVVDGED